MEARSDVRYLLRHRRTISVFATMAAVAVVLASAPGLAIKPYRDYARTPSDMDLAHTEVSILTRDGWNLAGWFLPAHAEPVGATVIVAYGDAGNMGMMLDHANAFGAHGFDVLLFDYRGFGSSDPFEIDPDRLTYAEYLGDLHAAVDHVVATRSGEIVLYGQSMGASIAIAVAGQRDDVAAVVAESPCTSTDEALELINATPDDSGRRFLPPVGFPDAAQPINAVTKFTDTALLVLTGAGDTVATPEMAFRLHSACPASNKGLWIAAGSSHGDIAVVYGDVFVDFVVTFMKNAVR